MNTKTISFTYVKIKGQHASFSPDGFSKGGGDNYDPIDHIEELRNHIWDGRKIYEKSQFQIVHETRVITEIDV